jgi:predicted permease
MLLARGAARTREMAVRSALGATRGRLVRQLIAESLVLAAAGGALGLLIARWATTMLERARLPIDIPLSFTLAFDHRVLFFTAVVAVATGLAFGLLPALRASRPALVPALKDDASLSGGGRRFGLRHALVTIQVAVSAVLLVAGVLVTRSLFSAGRLHPGFDAGQVVAATIALEMQGYDEARAREFFARAADRLRALAGVEVVATAERIPFSPNIQYTQIVVDGRPEATPERGASVDVARVSGDYFDALGIGLVRGRTFDGRDTPDRTRVAVVSSAFADRFFNGGDPVGQRLRLRDQSGPVIEIVGMSRDYDQHQVGEAPRPVLHLAASQRPDGAGGFLVRVAGDAGARTRDIESALRAMDPNLVFLELGPLDRLIAVSLQPVAIGSRLLAGLAALALLLSGLGLYGVIGFSVARRTREIGIRMALGSTRSHVVRQVVAEALVLVGVGGLTGLALGAGAAQALRALLYGVSPFDAVSYASAAALVLALAAVAAFLPARRAAGVDPVRALRHS